MTIPQNFLKILLLITVFVPRILLAQTEDEIKKILLKNTETYIPDFNYAGYHNGEKPLPNPTTTLLYATDFGVIANDALDDSKALIKA